MRATRPLDQSAVDAANDDFYAAHPEYIKDGQRVPLSASDPAESELRHEWMESYKAHGGAVEDDVPPKKSTDPVQPCEPPEPPVKEECPTDFQLVAKCRIVKANNGKIKITAKENPGFKAGTYSWTTTSTKIKLTNADTATVTVEGLANTSAAKDDEVIEVTRTSPDCAEIKKTIAVTVARVKFSKSTNQRYGYDNFDTPANFNDDHVNVAKLEHTFVKVDIEGGVVGTDFDFKCDAAICKVGPPAGTASFDLRLEGQDHDKKPTTLEARSKCDALFRKIEVHVYKERVVKVSVGKFDKTAAGTNMRFPTADYAAHATDANKKLKEGVVKYEITNYDATNKVTPVNFTSGTSVITYDIKAGGGADLTALSAAMSGVDANTVRVAIVRDMKSYYYLKNATAIGDTTFDVTAASTFYSPGSSMPLGTGASQENVSITGVSGSTITCAALTKAHAAGDGIEFNAAGWSSDPIIIIEGSAPLETAKWTVLHEVGHRDKGLNLRDIIDATDFMNFSQGWTDYRLRYCPRLLNYPAGTANKENQWETIPRD